jgi:hypothetical protein
MIIFRKVAPSGLMLFGDEKKSHQVVEKEMPRTDLQELCLRRCVGEVPRR